MKKLLSLVSLLVFLVSGCNQEEVLKNQSTSFNGKLFTASFEQNESRTYIENGKLLRWTEGDRISLFDGNALNREYKFDGETGDNGGTFSLVEKPYGTGNDLTANYAIYPYATNVKITEGGVITATLPAEQTYAENSFGLGDNTMVAVTQDIDDTFLKFKNVGGYLKLQLYGDDVTVKSITLQGNSIEKIAGKATITPVYGNVPTVSMADDATTTITLDCGEGVKIGSTSETATAFWIVVPPAVFSNGFSVTITDINEGSFTKTTSNEIVIERNIIKPMSAFEVEMKNVATIPNNQIWYTSSDGNIVTPYNNKAFGANIISNSYENGKGVITFDNDVTTIGYNAFLRCYSLTNISIPNSITTIGSSAFFYCTSLNNIIIPKNVTTIESRAFSGCNSLTSIIVEEGNSVYDSRNNCNGIIKTESNALTHACKNTNIPNTITSIEHNAFYYCASLTELIIPDNVKTIGYSAFYGCKSLVNIIIPNGVTTINGSAFGYCTSLSSIVIPNSVTTIESDAFADCSALESITISNRLNTISKNLFANCSSLTNIIIPNSVTTIGESVFFRCSSLRNIIIPNSVTTIESDAFADCSALESVTIPNSVTKIEEGTFGGCSSLASITMPSSITTIEDYTFLGCSSLKNVTIPNGVTSIGRSAFSDCTSLESITIPNSMTTIGYSAFYNCESLIDVEIPNSVYEIESSAFSGCSSLLTITIPSNVRVIGDYLLSSCNSLTSIVVEEGNSVYDSRNNCNAIIETGTNTLIQGCKNTQIPNNVTTIGGSAFSSCASLESITIPNSVTKIINWAFSYCQSLSKVELEAKTPPTIYDSTFKGCSNNIKFYVPEESLNDYNNAVYWGTFNIFPLNN